MHLLMLTRMLSLAGALALPDPSATLTVDAAQYQADVELLARQPRVPGSPGWVQAQSLCEQRLRSLGYSVELQQYDTGTNVIGVRRGSREPNLQVLVSAHYDSVPNSQGADDNASGVAGVLAIAGALAAQPPQARTLVVACWDEEERGMVGSYVYASRAHRQAESVRQSYVFEMIGYRDSRPHTQDLPTGFSLLFPGAAAELRALEYRGNSAIFVGNSRHTLRRLQAHAAAAGVPGIGLHVPNVLREAAVYRPLQRSDHASFWAAGYPSVMITDTADYRNPNYHTPDDTGLTLDIDYALSVVRATLGVVAEDLTSDS